VGKEIRSVCRWRRGCYSLKNQYVKQRKKNIENNKKKKSEG